MVRRQASQICLSAAEADGHREEQDTVSAMASLRVNNPLNVDALRVTNSLSIEAMRVSNSMGADCDDALSSDHQLSAGTGPLRVASSASMMADHCAGGGSLPSLPTAVMASRLSPLIVGTSPEQR